LLAPMAVNNYKLMFIGDLDQWADRSSPADNLRDASPNLAIPTMAVNNTKILV